MTEEQLAEIEAGLARDAQEPYPEHWETCTPSRMSPLIAEIRRLRAGIAETVACDEETYSGGGPYWVARWDESAMRDMLVELLGRK